MSKIKGVERREMSCYSESASKAATIDLQIKEDKEIVTEILTELGLARDAESMVSLTRLKQNPSKNTTNPPPLRLTLCTSRTLNEKEDGNSHRSIEEVLSAAKKLKESVKFKKVFINKDLTSVEIVLLKQLIVTQNDLNKKLEVSKATSSTIATYRYGIRSNRVVKILFKKN
jgi:hypothetical protein